MDEAAAAPITDEADIDLTAAPPPPAPGGGGPNDQHPHAGEEEPWPADDDATGDGGAPSATEPEIEPEPEPASPPPAPTPPAPPASGGQTDPDGGDEVEPPAEPQGGKKSGAAKRGYTLLEEQAVVPVSILTDAQRKTLEPKSVTGYVSREGDPIEGRNADLVLEQVYPDEDSVPEGVSAVLPLSERNFRPVVLDFEPVQKSRLKLKRR